MHAKYGYRVDGKPKRKPGPKKSGSKKRKAPKRRRPAAAKRKRRVGAKRRRVGSCLYGRTAAGTCRKKAYKSRGGQFKGWDYYQRTGLGKAIYDAPAGPALF